MSRRTWWAVALVVAVLAFGSGLELPSLPAVRLPALPRVALPRPALPDLPALPVPPLLPLALAGAALAGALVLRARQRRRRDPVGTALVLVRRGRPLGAVARETRLAQDAVRLLLPPGRG